MHGSMGGGRKPSQSGSHSRAARAPLAYPTILVPGLDHVLATDDTQRRELQGRLPDAREDAEVVIGCTSLYPPGVLAAPGFRNRGSAGCGNVGRGGVAARSS
jgi:hypothetical protein